MRRSRRCDGTAIRRSILILRDGRAALDLPPAAATFGIIAPKATPEDIVGKLNAGVQQDLTARAVLEKSSLLPSGGTPAAYKAFVADQIASAGAYP